MDRFVREHVIEHRPMKEVTSFQIGGPVDYFIEPRTEEELRQVIVAVQKENLPWMVMGKGTNMVVSDKGIRGAVIRLENYFAGVRVDGTPVPHSEKWRRRPVRHPWRAWNLPTGFPAPWEAP